MVTELPTFYFHLREGEKLEKDLEGTEFDSAERAYEEAVMAAREIMAAKVASGEVVDGQVFEVTDQTGMILYRLPLRSVIKLD
jgi:hypothetical protein